MKADFLHILFTFGRALGAYSVCPMYTHHPPTGKYISRVFVLLNLAESGIARHREGENKFKNTQKREEAATYHKDDVRISDAKGAILIGRNLCRLQIVDHKHLHASGITLTKTQAQRRGGGKEEKTALTASFQHLWQKCPSSRGTGVAGFGKTEGMYVKHGPYNRKK